MQPPFLTASPSVLPPRIPARASPQSLPCSIRPTRIRQPRPRHAALEPRVTGPFHPPPRASLLASLGLDLCPEPAHSTFPNLLLCRVKPPPRLLSWPLADSFHARCRC
ncbi:hypothetical protein ZWY2020_042834 [Hordeum vulgare]|nr:hypothetical protein ZWY2020_042834 [Hordeum vulgare]